MFKRITSPIWLICHVTETWLVSFNDGPEPTLIMMFQEQQCKTDHVIIHGSPIGTTCSEVDLHEDAICGCWEKFDRMEHFLHINSLLIMSFYWVKHIQLCLL